MNHYDNIEDDDIGVLYVLKVYKNDGTFWYATTATKEKYLKTKINRINHINETREGWWAQHTPLTMKTYRLVGKWNEYEMPDPKQKALFK